MVEMIIDGKAIAAKRLEGLRTQVLGFRNKPKLAVILVGNDLASELYVSTKARRAQEVGIISDIYKFVTDTTDKQLIKQIQILNNDPSITGILVQLPFPNDTICEANERQILDSIDPQKDVDCLTSTNLGLLAGGNPRFYPATVKGILTLLGEVLNRDLFGKQTSYKKTKYLLADKTAVVIGRSAIVGKPMATALTNLGATVTICNAKTENLGNVTKMADILVVAAGSKNLIMADMVKPGSVVIDVGVNRKEEKEIVKGGKKIVGDIDFENIQSIAGFVTPVPGGVGPMTIISLLENTIQAAYN